MPEIELYEAELRCLYTDLVYGEYGDWKIAKYYEYFLSGLEAPYNIKELHKKRQAMRDRINELEELINNFRTEIEEPKEV